MGFSLFIFIIHYFILFTNYFIFYCSFSHILLWMDCAKFYVLFNLVLKLFLGDLSLFKKQLILNSYKRMGLEEEGMKWKTQQIWVVNHKFWKICTLILQIKQSCKLYNFNSSKLFQFYFGTKVYFYYFFVPGWERREIAGLQR
jgi:hypothetical protein